MSGPAIERVFLGWNAGALERAAKWILARHGEDVESVVVALPGSRAARALKEKLARRARPSWKPPSVLTQGDLIDAMVTPDRPVAGRLARTLAWARALAELPRERLERLAARPPEPGDKRGVLALAETVRALHAELAQEGIEFERLARGADRPASPGEAMRFEALAEAQARWRAILGGLGLVDPHESRFAAIDAGRVDPRRRIVLVGVADMNHLLRRLVHGLGERACALIVAPETEAEAFDELGCVRTEAWKDRELDLPRGRWRATQGPADQADVAISILAGFDGRFAAEEVSIGVCDEEVSPHLERRLLEESVVGRRAAGLAVELTRPHRLLAELAAWLPQRAYAPYATLLRHADLDPIVRRPGVDPLAELDAYHAKHLPGTIEGHAELLRRLGDLAASGLRPLASWPAAMRSFLGAVYAGELDVRVEDERVLAESLAILAKALEEIEQLPGTLGTAPASAAEAVELALAIARGDSVPPPPAGPGAIELLGWLDLPLDDARAVVVTGFQEGIVPRVRRDDPFLPDGRRRRLGLPCADDRLARDLYAATVILGSKEEVAFVSGRRDRDGDPRMPSRLAFHVPRARLLERVGDLIDATGTQKAPAAARASRYVLPRREPSPRVESMRVTSFRSYLESPYGFYLEHVLGLKTIDDAAREMDPKAFGDLLHAVLEDFGKSPAVASTDAREIEDRLRAAVERIGRERYGVRPLPAIEIQLAQLERRLAFFARAQARRAADGWRIRAVEWTPEQPVSLAMGDGEESMRLRGKIDRIDFHEATGRWAVLDYKTKAEDPEKAHRARSGAWRDLQLPLYTQLAAELVPGSAPELAYFTIGREEAETRIRPAAWGPEDVESALETAREVVRDVRAGKFFELGRWSPREPILLAIAGRGLVEGSAEAVEEECEA